MGSFDCSPLFTQATERLRTFFLRGQEVDLDYLRKTGILTKIYDGKSDVHVINILGYALNKPVAKFDLPADQLEKMLRTGDICMYSKEAKEQLQKVVKQMEGYRFELIPLVVVAEYKEHKLFETLLIKVHGLYKVSYVDMSGRIYTSFDHFLNKNVLPHGILCYPKDGKVVFNDRNELLVDYQEVGLANSKKMNADLLVGLLGTAGTVGSIFATGGLAAPFIWLSCGSALYGTGRCVEKLIDASDHGLSVNPCESAEARNNWLMMSANLLTFASFGAAAGLATATKMEGVTVQQLGRIMMGSRIIRGVSAGVNAITVLDSIVYTAINWHRMSIYEKMSLASAVCFCFREVISFANAERLIRASQIEGLCTFFKSCAISAVGDVGMKDMSNISQRFVTQVKKTFEDNEEYVATAMELVRTLVLDNFQISVSDDFTLIKLFGLEYKIRNIISMPKTELNKFLYMIQGIANTFKDAFSLMRKMWGDGPIAKAVFKRAEENGGNRADYGKALNELIEIFNLLRKISDDISILTDAQLKIGGGHHFTIGTAYETFVKSGLGKGISLLRALVEMNPREIERMNNLRNKWGNKEAEIFEYVTHNSADSAEILSKLRFLLDVNETCTESFLHITDLHSSEQTVEIESMIRVSIDQFRQAVNPDYLMNPKILHICHRALANHRNFIESIWKNTCNSPDTVDKSFEKLTVLEAAFESRTDAAIENVISYVSKMQCSDFSRFVTHSLFALDRMDSLIREMNLSEEEANDILFSDLAPLRSRFLELSEKAEEHSLGGYYAVEDHLLNAEDGELIAAIKDSASKGDLRFGTVENGALHLGKYPMLRFGKKELQKYNRFIAQKKFDREEVQLAYKGKRLVLLANEQLRIIVGLVQGVGFYIDTFMFAHMD